MRVLTFTSLFPNAAEPLLGVFVAQRMAHFAKRPGNLVQVLAPVPYFPGWLPAATWGKWSRVPKREQIAGLEVYHPRYPFIPKMSVLHGLSMYAASLSLASRLHRQTKFDCIDAHYVYPDGFAAVLLGKRLGIPVVVSARGTDINLFPSFRSIRPMIRWTLKQAAGTIGVCEALRTAMVDLGARDERSVAIGNGIDLERFSLVAKQDARRKLGIAADCRIIISVGVLIPRKGYPFLISAFAAIAQNFPKARLYIVGEGPSRAELEELIREQKLEDRIFLVGSKPNDELKYWYSAADVSCLASSREGWANVLLESMACGTPVVATRVWGAPEVIVSPELGVLVEQSKASIAQGLQEALQKEWNHNTLIGYAASRTWDVVAQEVERFFELRIGAWRRPKALHGR
jgi:teichuronic acid biosynthesis glycosyltransferase TuaC